MLSSILLTFACWSLLFGSVLTIIAIPVHLDTLDKTEPRPKLSIGVQAFWSISFVAALGCLATLINYWKQW